MNIVMALCLGISLSAACGFRVFIPPLALSIASHSGVIQLSSDWQWLGTYPAITTLGIAATVEIIAYFIPWVNNFLDSIEIGVAPIAGMFITASTLSIAGDFDPTFLWVMAVIAGGVTAETMELGTSLTRLIASGTTAGVGGTTVSFVEATSSIVISSLAITVPNLSIFLVVFLMIDAVRRILKFVSKRKQRQKMKQRY